MIQQTLSILSKGTENPTYQYSAIYDNQEVETPINK